MRAAMLFSLLTALPCAFALAPLSRRDVGRALVGGGAALAPLVAGAADVTACKKGANNCWSTVDGTFAWKFPGKKGDAVKTLKAALDAYPQEGQNKVDLGGWSYAVDELASTGYARLEFKSGIGNFAKFLNGGKPFVDDLEVLVGDSSVSVKSASRIGDSDLGVNAKRLQYLAAALKAQGWEATAPSS
mmetsp:Transcript_15805/g.47152  ORF Transcript_15805/g.47152 Transcript_15805/m.47152 type:complete len:188 (+) Transcript_15805:171-734(+)|eukprot:CAMPEP_0119264382 /NCGR_PEP_ID=MMETSP1329-20130426/3478_1 /TAXON_ID=114041 /ORGANISM="Genus nov. species nov., Strain RCC1024" /LENGTH=187 /DNA_ID=CAMNT_0007264145 /DNA_START=150 /DNA_END=713 /DNA_ORIENTATION=+